MSSTLRGIPASLALAITLFGAPAAAQEKGAEPPSWAELAKHRVPEWFADAKFGIYAHLGVYCVPAFGNEWYPRNMYREGAVQRFHEEHFGKIEEFGYKDFIPLFKLEKFDPEEWAALYAEAGARFAGPVAEHHDGFSMWASEVNRWNAGAMGPHRDVAGELIAALRRRGLKIITSFHHAFNIQGYYPVVAGCDTADPAFGDLYGKFADPRVAHERWLAKIEEVIDAYRPDQIWFDFGLAKIPDVTKRRMVAAYYGKAAEWGKEVIITRKGEQLPPGVAVLDIERGKMKGLADELWQTDDATATNSWCWVRGLQLKPAQELVHELIDIVSKNGVLLLNVCPKGDGTIPPDQRALLREIGAWLAVNGEAIYATRPWAIHGEGPNLLDKGRGFGGPARRFGAADVRYTRSKDGATLYVIALGWPRGTLALDAVLVDGAGPAARAELLGVGALRYSVEPGSKRLSLHFPSLAAERRPCRYACAVRLSGFKLRPSPFARPEAVTLKAEQALLEGDGLHLERKGEGEQNIGFWNDGGERAHWLVRIARAGKYQLRASCAAVQASALRIEVAGQALVAPILATGGWDPPRSIDLGTLRFERPGVYHLVVGAADPDTWRAVNLWQLQLAPLR